MKQTEGWDYIAMEYVHGESLAEVTAGHPLAPHLAADYVQQAALAVHYANAHELSLA